MTLPQAAQRWIAHERAGFASRRVADLASEQRVSLLAIKGVVTARSLYADVADRHCGDVDLRLRPEDAPRLVRALRSAGLEVREGFARLHERTVEVGGVLVELEGAIGLPGLCRLSLDEVLERSRLLPEHLGPWLRVPELHDHTLLLALNAWQDAGAVFPWTREDLLRIVQQEAFSDAHFVELCERAGVGRLVAWQARWLADESPAWAEILGRLLGSGAGGHSFPAGRLMAWCRVHPERQRLRHFVGYVGGDHPRDMARGLLSALQGHAERQLLRVRAMAQRATSTNPRA